MIKKLLLQIPLLFLVLGFFTAHSQQYLYTAATGTANTIPFAGATNFRQYIYYPSDFPTAPAGNITVLYFKASTATAVNFTNLTIKMGHTSLNTFTAGPYVTGLTTVYSGPFSGTPITGNYVMVTLQTPFPYNGSQNFIVEASQTGYSPGFSVIQATANVTARSLYGTIGAASGSVQDRLAHFGFDLTVGGTPCSGIPTAGTATGPASACAGGPITLSLSGFTNAPGASIQWQSSPATTNQWMPIAGATFASLNTTQTSTTDYRAVVTCANGGASDISNIVTVGMNQPYLCYCSPNTGVTLHGTTANYITNVNIPTTSFNVSTSATGAGGYTQNYPLTATNTVSLVQGQSYTLNATIASASYSTELWIDWDQSGTFDAGEYTLLTPGTTATTTISVPVTAVPGLTGMRLRNVASGTTLHGNTGACANISVGRETEDYLITVVAGVPCSGAPSNAGTISSNVSSVCVSGNVSFSAVNTPTELGITYQWQSSPAGQNNWTSIAGATGLNYTAVGINANTDFRLAAICGNPGGGTGYSSNTITIAANNPSLASVTGATRCGTGTVNLSATPVSGTVNWYATATGGIPLATGTASFTTPSISSTTTYYAAATTGGQSQTSAMPPTLPNVSTTTYAGLVIDVNQPLVLNSVNVFSINGGTVSVELRNSAGTIIAGPTVFPLVASTYTTPQNLQLNWAIPAGTGYRLLATPSLALAYQGGTYPLPLGNNAGNIVNGAVGSGTSTSTLNYYFYNLQTSTGCEGTRMPVTATVTTPPAYTLAASPDTICLGSSSVLTATSANAYSYTWTPGGSGNNISVSPSATTKYYLSGTDGNNCGIYDSVLVTVKQVAATTTTAVPTSICVSGSVNLSLNPVPMQGILIQWQKNTGSGYVNISGANAATLSDPVTTTTSYRAQFYCNGNLVGASTPVSVPYSNPSVLSTVPGSRCGTGSVTLLAMGAAGASINWYSAATGGSSLGTGNAFVTPSISSTTTYYAAPVTGGASSATVPELIYYKFDGTGTTVPNQASAPVSATGTVQGSATIGGTGQFGGALNGSGAATASNSVNANWPLNLTGPWTMSMWISGVTNTLSSNYLFGGSGGSTFRALTGSGVVAGAGNLEIRGTGMTDVFLNNIFDATGTPVVVHFVYDPTIPAIKGYVNGVLNTTIAQTANMVLTGTDFTVGGQAASVGLPVGGKIDEFRLYNRALSAAEIASTWNITLPGGCEGPRTPVAATINAGSSGTGLSTGGTVVGLSQADGTTVDYLDPCNDKVATVADAAGGNVLGNTSAIVLTSPTVQTQGFAPYVPRVFDIAPASNGPATVSLYALQSEFNAYNTYVLTNNLGLPLLPTGPADLVGISHIVLTQYHGAASAGTAGPYGLYSNANVQLIPNSAITATSNGTYWTITFPVTGFSGFFIHTGSSPLLVDLKTISATNFGSRNRIDWSTASEAAGDILAIERSADGHNFTRMGIVAAKGQASSYSYWDEHPFTGINYYRIKMNNANGSSFYSSVVTATVKAGTSFNVEAYPNPVTDVLTVRLIGTPAANSTAAITDVTGKIIKSISLSGSSTEINMGGLAKGIYLVKYSDAAHSQTIRITKQ